MRLILTILSSLAITALSTSAFATECTSNGSCCKKLNELWQTKYFKKDFNIDSSNEVEAKSSFKCPSQLSRLAEAFYIIDILSSNDSSLDDFYTATKEAINGYSIYLVPIESYGTTDIVFKSILLSSKYSSELSPSTYAATVIHEGIHAEGGERHSECKKGLVKGSKNCDDLFLNQVESLSSYTREFMFLYNIRNIETTDLQKKTAKYKMMEIFENNFNSVPSKGPDSKTPIRDYYDI